MAKVKTTSFGTVRKVHRTKLPIAMSSPKPHQAMPRSGEHRRRYLVYTSQKVSSSQRKKRCDNFFKRQKKSNKIIGVSICKRLLSLRR
eukprot:5828664-Amphidinium_carterae.2